MRTIEQIEADIRWERDGLRVARESQDSADAKMDEIGYNAARARVIAHCQKMDELKVERLKARYAALSGKVNTGAFSPRFQAVEDGNHYSILDIRDGVEVDWGLERGSLAEARAREMCHFSRLRELAEKAHAKPINLSVPHRKVRTA